MIRFCSKYSNLGRANSPRDIQLDAYRALVMIWILCIVHVAYWLGALGQPLSSLILFEMPVIFFISGGAISVSGKHRGLSDTITNRAKRVLAPYYVLAAVCVFAFLTIGCILDNQIFQEQASTVILKAL